MNYESSKVLSDARFKRLVGLYSGEWGGRGKNLCPNSSHKSFSLPI